MSSKAEAPRGPAPSGGVRKKKKKQKKVKRTDAAAPSGGGAAPPGAPGGSNWALLATKIGAGENSKARRRAEARQEGGEGRVGALVVLRAHGEMRAGARLRAVRHDAHLEKYVLQYGLSQGFLAEIAFEATQERKTIPILDQLSK